MASKLYDIFADVGIGALSDRTRTPWGRRRPYLLAGSVVSVASILMIFLTNGLHGLGLILYMAAALVIYSTGYSLFNVPYFAMPAEMTDGYQERVRLMSYRTAFIGIGSLISIAGTAALIKLGGGGVGGYRLMAMVMAGVGGATMLMSFLGTRQARQSSPPRKPFAPSLADLASILANRPLLFLMTAKTDAVFGLRHYLAGKSAVHAERLEDRLFRPNQPRRRAERRRLRLDASLAQAQQADRQAVLLHAGRVDHGHHLFELALDRPRREHAADLASRPNLRLWFGGIAFDEHVHASRRHRVRPFAHRASGARGFSQASMRSSRKAASPSAPVSWDGSWPPAATPPPPGACWSSSPAQPRRECISASASFPQ